MMVTQDTHVATLALRMATKALEMLHALPIPEDGKDGLNGKGPLTTNTDVQVGITWRELT